MSNERETISYEVGGKLFVIKSWLTAGEEQAINSVMMDKVSFNPNMKPSDAREGKMDMDFGQIPISITIEQQNKKLETAIVSIDGDTNNILKKCLDMRNSDFQKLQTKINEIVDGGLE